MSCPSHLWGRKQQLHQGCWSGILGSARAGDCQAPVPRAPGHGARWSSHTAMGGASGGESKGPARGRSPIRGCHSQDATDAQIDGRAPGPQRGERHGFQVHGWEWMALHMVTRSDVWGLRASRNSVSRGHVLQSEGERHILTNIKPGAFVVK